MKPVDLEETLRSSFMAQAASLYTCIPCIVLSTAGLSEQRIDVQPIINKRYKNERVEEHPPILSVPVIFPASRTASLTFPIETGDTVLCVFSQRGLDTFKAGKGGFVTPTDFRKFDKRDAIAIPGLFPFASAANKQTNRALPHNTGDTVLAHNLGKGTEVEIRLKADGSVAIKSPASVTVECQTATINCSTSMAVTAPNTVWSGNMTMTGNITLNGGLVQNGSYTLDGVNMNNHIHGGVMGGLGTTAGPQ